MPVSRRRHGISCWLMLAACGLALIFRVGQKAQGGCADAAAAVSAAGGGGQFGSLSLCPTGGRSFMMAWSLACEMKKRRRRKRAVEQLAEDDATPDEAKVKKRNASYRPATLSEIQEICCRFGCEIRDLLSYCDPFGPWNS